MLANLEAFVAVGTHGTMMAAAARLHLTQSAISKRIQALESSVGRKLFERVGTRVRLTAEGQRLYAHLIPLMAELRKLLLEEVAEHSGYLSVVMSESVLISWGAQTMMEIVREMPDVIIDFDADRPTLVIEAVRSGTGMVAVVPGQAIHAPDLQFEPLGEDEIVIVPANLKPFRWARGQTIEVIGVHRKHEVSSFIWRGIEEVSRRSGVTFKMDKTYNTYVIVTELARAGFCHGVVSKLTALRLGVPKNRLMHFPKPGVKVPLSLVGRSTSLSRPVIRRFKEVIRSKMPRELLGKQARQQN